MKHVIIGAGPAGIVGAETIRKGDPAADITILNGEREPPYSRMAIPYLLNKDIGESGTYLRSDPNHYEKLRLKLVNQSATAIDTASRTVKLDNGESLPYDRLLIAAGSHSSFQKIPGIDLPGVYGCWTLADARAIIAGAKPGARIVQMGAGFCGCIIIPGLLKYKFELTILVRSGRMVSRMMTPTASAMMKRWCESKGVKVIVNTQSEKITQAADGSLEVTVTGGQVMPADIFLCLVGVSANTGFLAGSGIDVNWGVRVDDTMQTNVPGVYAAGDVAEFTDCITGESTTNAIQPNAVDQARIAAHNMLGQRDSSRGSFAFNVLNTMGLLTCSFGAWGGVPGGEAAELVDEEHYRYLHLEFKDDYLVGACGVGITDHIGVLRGLIEGKVALGEWKQRLLRDPTRIVEAHLARAQAALV